MDTPPRTRAGAPLAARRPAFAFLALAALLAGCGKSQPGSTADSPVEAQGSAAAKDAPQGASPPDAPASAEAAEDEPPPGQPVSAPIVSLSGVATLPPPPPEGSPRLASTALLTRVYARPSTSAKRVGFLRAGAIVEMDPEPAGTDGCPGGWRKIKPFGYVCIGPDATLDLQHEIVRAASRRPDVTDKLPYMYGIVTRGGPAYARIPTEEHLAQYEPNLEKHLDRWAKDEESGAAYGLDVWLKWSAERPPPALEALAQRITDRDIPWFLRDGRLAPNLSGLIKSDDAVKIDAISRRNGMGFVESFLHEGRRYNVTTDLRVVPADRFRPIRGSDYHGVEIGKDIDFPFALVRRPGGKRWRVEGKKLVSAGELEWRAAVPLTGKQQFFGGKLHYETKDGAWIDDRHAGRIDPAKRMPAWGKRGEKWIDINLTKQVLVAYEGETPVYATLISSGEAGLEDHETSTATKRGIFRIHTKYISITMDSDAVGEEFELRDVPYVQYFEEGYALHGAYWHDKFGRPKSHGCINLSPEDARRLFFWTEPAVPPGWHGSARSLTGTVVFVHP
ncbi:L,D-transpeptidase family protein [Sorangium sp. So ce1036]|uniref:L,D-transpeptidase n=1 Tax=Sorangium sp. So ce1036 TaxID=3133328 RepID=UPI003F0FD99F